jgi:predicted transcriptional regulator
MRDIPVAATSLKLSDELKRRIEALAAIAGKTPHAFMVEALTRETERLELRKRFAAEAAQSEAETMASGKAVPLNDAFTYLDARLAGRKTRRPRLRRWRESK